LKSGEVQKGLNKIPKTLITSLTITEQATCYKRYGGFPKSFHWLLEHLMPPSSKENIIKGCDIILPDTVFFTAGKASSIFKMDKEFCLCAIKNPKKLTN